MLRSLFQVGILLPTRAMSRDEIDYFIKREYVANLALQRFMAMEISWGDYLDILETCDMDIDDYLITVDNNCAEALG